MGAGGSAQRHHTARISAARTGATSPRNRYALLSFDLLYNTGPGPAYSIIWKIPSFAFLTRSNSLLGRLWYLQTLLPLLLDLPCHSLIGVDSLVGVFLDEIRHDLSANNNQSHEYRSSREPGNVAWRICLWPEEDTVDRSRVTHSIDSSFLSREGNNVRHPDEGKRTNAVDRSKSEDDEYVLDHMVRGGDTDDEAYTAECGESTDEHWFVLVVIG
jgi:hypothetical protein